MPWGLSHLLEPRLGGAEVQREEGQGGQSFTLSTTHLGHCSDKQGRGQGGRGKRDESPNEGTRGKVMKRQHQESIQGLGFMLAAASNTF